MGIVKPLQEGKCLFGIKESPFRGRGFRQKPRQCPDPLTKERESGFCGKRRKMEEGVFKKRVLVPTSKAGFVLID